MADRILTQRELNRATLERQMLLARATEPVTTAIAQLVGLQAQLASAPYVGLWTRLQDFRRADLAAAIEQRTVIKATVMRATLHLCTADDYLHFRTTFQPMLSGAGESISKRRTADFDRAALLAAARAYLAAAPRTFAEISDMVTALMPAYDVGAMRYTIRTEIPLVQVPIDSGWSYSSKPAFTLAEAWLGRTIDPTDHLRDLIFRYLAAFGPASVTDMQTWCGLGKLKEIFTTLKPELQSYRDENRRELFDLPDRPLPPAETPAPIRFLPEFDNLLLSHSNRTRVVADAHRTKVYLPGLRVAATVLIDGVVQGVWKVAKSKGIATLQIEPLIKLTQAQQQEIITEGEQLVRFLEPQAKDYAVQFAT